MVEMIKETMAKRGIVDAGEVSDKVIRRCAKIAQQLLGFTKSGAPNRLAMVGM